MGRPRLSALNPGEASRFRDLVRTTLRESGLRQRDLVELEGAPPRTLRWIQSIMVKERRLSIHLAHELIQRLRLSGALRSTVNSLRPFLQIVNAKKKVEENKAAAVIIFPDEAEKLADALSQQLASVPGIGPVTRRALKSRFEDFLVRYEDVFKIKPGQNLLRYLQRCYGDEWKILFTGELRLVAQLVQGLSRAAAEETRHVAINVTHPRERSKLRSNPKFRSGDAAWLGAYIQDQRERRRVR